MLCYTIPMTESAKELRADYDAKYDWVEALLWMGELSVRERNPHQHCNTQSSEPCPTGVHQNPYPLPEQE